MSNFDASPPPPPPVDSRPPEGKPPWWKRGVPLWAVILIGLVCIGIGGASASGGAEGESEVAAVDSGGVDDLREQLDKRDETIDELSSEIEVLEAAAEAELEGMAETTTTTAAPTTTTTAAPTTTTTTAPPQPETVAAYEGVVDTQTPDFTVTDGWELRWDAPGGLGCVFYVENSASGRNYGSIDSEDQPQGSSFFRDGGTYYLDIKCYGASYWKVSVVDLP